MESEDYVQPEPPASSSKEFSAAEAAIETFCAQAEEQVPVLRTLWEGWPKALEVVRQKTSQAAPCSRVAVIGSIKSGKSTFVNALLRSDILRRGAGTLTSAITRMVPCDAPRATITWKGWQRANREAGFAAALLAAMTGLEAPPHELDLRESAQREAILRLLAGIGPSPNGLPGHALNQLARLRSLSNGFPRVSPHMLEESTVSVLEREWFLQHREIVCSDETASYVDDVLVEYPFPKGLAAAEIADCQGSDSLNPSHLGHVQEYLLRADWVIYLVNSVMGLRQADEKLLDVVKSLGLAEHVVFVLNTEVDVHGDLKDLQRVRSAVEKWVAARIGPPRLYTVSVLLELFDELAARELLSQRESDRLASWKQDAEMAAALKSRWQELLTFWRDEIAPAAGRFQRSFTQRCLVNLLGRLRNCVRIAANPYELDQAALEVCSIEAEKLLPNMEAHLDGASTRTESEVRAELGRFLDPNASEIGKNLNRFVDAFSSQWDPTATAADGRLPDVNGMTLAIAEEFNQALHAFLVEHVNTEIARQAQVLVRKTQQDFDTVVDMYQVVLRNNYLKLSQSHQPVTGGKGSEAASGEARDFSAAQADRAQRRAAPADSREHLPSPSIGLFSTEVQLSLTQKTLVAARQSWMLSFRKLRAWFSERVMKKPPQDRAVMKAEVLLRWRERTLGVIKTEARTLICEEMVRFRDHLKYQAIGGYIRDLASACKKDLRKQIEDFRSDLQHAQQAPGFTDREVLAARSQLPLWEERLREIESWVRQ
ncbi:MAG: dynamin family protein [bacterium]